LILHVVQPRQPCEWREARVPVDSSFEKLVEYRHVWTQLTYNKGFITKAISELQHRYPSKGIHELFVYDELLNGASILQGKLPSAYYNTSWRTS
jgi:hypothetical protein